MKLDVSYRDINKESHKTTRDKIRQVAERHLEPYLTTFNSSQLRLHATVELHKNKYTVSLRLHVPPKKIMFAKETDENVNTAINKAVAELARQAERHHSHISGREQWKRNQRRTRLKDLQKQFESILPEPQKQLSRQSVSALLPRIEHYIKHELVFLRANGDLFPGYPTLEDIRDEALAQLKIRWSDLQGNDEAIYQELLKAVNQVIQNEVEQNRLHANDVSLEAVPEKDAMDQAEESVDDEIYEFYQPYEMLHVEDLIEDTSELTPEELAEIETREASYQIMSSMPTNWRRIVVLVNQEGLSLDAVANNILSIPIDHATRLLEQAETFMLDSLLERGIRDINRDKLIRVLKRY
jgi:ribosome-associated translation inhibitor RaiA